MTQIFIDSNGQRHEFPDDATPEEIDAATGGGGTGGSGGGGDSTTPPAKRDYTQELLNGLSKLGSVTDNLRALNRGITFGGWDNVVGGVKSLLGQGSPAEERQKTAEAKSRLPLHGVVPESAGSALTTYLTGGVAPATVPATLTGTVGTGAVLSGIQAENDRKDPLNVGIDMTTGGLFGGALHGLTKALAPKAPVRPNTAADDLNNMTQDEWNSIKDYVYPRSALDDVWRASKNDAENTITSIASGNPLTKTSVDKPSAKLYEKFGDRFEIVKPVKGQTGTPGTPVWPAEVDKWRNDALNADSPYGDILASRLEELMQGGPTIKISKLGGKAEPRTPEVDAQNTDAAYQGILAARKAQARTDAVRALDDAQQTGTNTPIKKVLNDPDLDPGIQEVLRQADKGTFVSNTLDRINKQGPNIIRAATAPVAGWLGFKGAPKEALTAAIGGFGAAPATGALTQPLSDAARAQMLQEMRDRITGAFRPQPDTSVEDRFRQMLLGGWAAQQ